ncbi:uncharacterized protein LOC115214836 [Octopus sinensis]|uniref:Uncharacterized protein LOC115214836 n=1 Tax=Octopus sinensis TaxID=2607531 RepID=A0A6P7SN73_9MOLL|nr:uncharacterized protein LOC115214836 [Octopus sinensis]
MRMTLKHLFVLCIISTSIGIYILSHIRLYKLCRLHENMKIKQRVYGPLKITNEDTWKVKTAAQKLLHMILESDSTFSLLGFDGPLERMDLLCWMYLSQTATKRGLKANSSDCLQPPPGKEWKTVPKNVFYIIYGAYNFTFLNYMSAFSIRRVIPDANIYVIGDQSPIGFWWRKLLEDVRGVKIVYRTRPQRIFNQTIKIKPHATDVIRLQILILSGGIYLDPDILFLRPIDHFRQPVLTMGLIDPATGIGNGLIFAKIHSKFLEYWYESYRNFNSSIWGVHSMAIPLKLSKIYSHLIKVDKGHIYHPNWFELEKLFLKVVPWDKNVAVHMWTHHQYRLPQSLKDTDTLNTTAGQMLRYVYYNDTRLRR